MVPEIQIAADRLFVILGHFWPNLENQNIKKTRKIPRDIIILNMCTINYDHMVYSS